MDNPDGRLNAEESRNKMIMRLNKSLCLGLVMALTASCGGGASNSSTTTATSSSVDVTKLTEETADNIGSFAFDNSSYSAMIVAGAKVVNVPQLGSWFLVWVPSDYSSQKTRRVMIATHGTKGTAYAEAKDELSYAQANHYAILAPQWWMSATDSYLAPSDVYQLIDTGMRYLTWKHGASLGKAAYEGFSRGSSISYEVTYWDKAKATNHIALTISHSGGMPANQLTPFFAQVAQGAYGATPFAGTNFYMYCGMKDEQWGTQMCQYMTDARNLIEPRGATIVRFIQDPDGSHGGYKTLSDYHQVAIDRFLALTP